MLILIPFNTTRLGYFSLEYFYEFIEVDVAGLNAGESIHLSDLKLGEGVESLALLHGAEHDLAVVTIQKRGGGGEEEEGEEEAGGE